MVQPQVFHIYLYDTLIDVNQSATLLSANPPYLQQYLADQSGLAGALTLASADAPPVGPLDAKQCARAELLAKLFVSRERFREAAAVYRSLAMRRAGSGDQGVPLDQRVRYLEAAVLQVSWML